MVRSRRRFSQRRVACRRTIHAEESLSSDVRGDNRGPEGLYAALEDQVPLISPDREQRSTAGVQVCAVYRRHALWALSEAIGGWNHEISILDWPGDRYRHAFHIFRGWAGAQESHKNRHTKDAVGRSGFAGCLE